MDVTLTFDNGPEPAVTPRVLEVLAKHEVPATFFVLGAKLAAPGGRRLAEAACAAGHWIGNHTMTHAMPLGRIPDPARVESEILEAQVLIGSLAHPGRLFRPFGGGGRIGTHLLGRAAVEVLRREKMTCVLWNAVPRDWEDAEGWVQTALAQCREQNWALLVLHDLPGGAMDRLEFFIREARKRGARFRQDFPPDCVPIVRGEPAVPLEPYGWAAFQGENSAS